MYTTGQMFEIMHLFEQIYSKNSNIVYYYYSLNNCFLCKYM